MRNGKDLTGAADRLRDARNLLVVDLGFLGDTVQLVPVLWEIKRQCPQARLHVISAPVGAEVLALVPCVDRAWPLILDRQRRTLGEQWRLVRALRAERFEGAFNFSGADRATILTGLSGARWRVGHAAGRSHFWNRWLIPNWVPRQNPKLPVFEQRRQILAACGFSLQSPRFDLQVAPADAEWAAGVVPAGAMHLSVNSAKALKEWPLEHHQALLAEVWRRQPATVVVASAGGGEREKVRLRQLRELVPDARLQLLPGGLSIGRLAAVLQRCRLHFGPDSGVVHLAAALGVPTIAYFRGQPGYECWVQPGPRHQALIAPCSCGDDRESPCGAVDRAACLDRLAPADLAELVTTRLTAKP